MSPESSPTPAPLEHELSDGTKNITEVTIHPEEQKTENPESNWIDRLDGLFYRFSQVTRKSRTNGVNRPLSHRRERAKTLQEIRSVDRHDPAQRQYIHELIDRSNEHDEVLVDYLAQGEVEIDMPNLGIQKATYTTIAPPENEYAQEQSNTVPIVVLGGISNALQAMQPLTEEIAIQGRHVITFGYPEDPMGTVTQEFADEVCEGDPFSAHGEFYTHAITKMMQDGTISSPTIDIWGYSTGAAIAAHMLNNPEFSKIVEKAAFICPAGTTDQSSTQMNMGVLHEAGRALKKLGDLASYSLVMPRKEEKNPKKDRTFKGMTAHIGKKHEASYINARVRPGGKIVTLIENDDQITKNFLEVHTLARNPQTTILRDSGSHLTPLFDADRVVSSILNQQD